MKNLQYGDEGALVALLQKGLARAGEYPGAIDGLFGGGTRAALLSFQRKRALQADGIAGAQTYAALEPWLTGRRLYTVRPGDTLWRITLASGVSLRELETANPGVDPYDLRPGRVLTVPLPFPVVPADVPASSALTAYCVQGLHARYPFLRVGSVGQSVLGRPIFALTLGAGSRRVLYNAAHHANEWITALLLLRYAEALCRSYAAGERFYGLAAQELLATVTICLVPLVNPDGVDLVTGALTAAEGAGAAAIAAAWPDIPFPDGWKANLRGVDLNLQYPASWDEARRIKFAQGYTAPAPRDYVGSAPLVAPESRALYDYTLSLSPALILAYHTQGRVIYWKYLDREPAGSYELAQRLAAASGYAAEETPYASGFAGYKDWFIERFDRPGYTVEAGEGENPLPLTQLERIYADNAPLLTLAALG